MKKKVFRRRNTSYKDWQIASVIIGGGQGWEKTLIPVNEDVNCYNLQKRVILAIYVRNRNFTCGNLS